MPGPEVPFPLREESDRTAAEKFGFCKDCPFPGPVRTPEFKIAGHTLKRQLGVGTYTASEIAGVVTITATGTAPNFNTIVQLVQLPLMIWPPRFALYFTEPEISIPTTHPFKVEAFLHTHQVLDAIIVQDHNGIHTVEVINS